MATDLTARILAEIDRRGLTLERYPHSVRLRGRGVDVLARRLGDIDWRDLVPANTQGGFKTQPRQR